MYSQVKQVFELFAVQHLSCVYCYLQVFGLYPFFPVFSYLKTC